MQVAPFELHERPKKLVDFQLLALPEKTLFVAAGLELEVMIVGGCSHRRVQGSGFRIGLY
jgi:hypothetical protein